MLIESQRRRRRAFAGAFPSHRLPPRQRRAEPGAIVDTALRQDDDSAVMPASVPPSLPPPMLPPPSRRRRAAFASRMDAQSLDLNGATSRLRQLVHERELTVAQRRRRRCELLEEIRRLRGVMSDLEGEVDHTVRSIAAMDQFVRHLSQISFMAPENDSENHERAVDSDQQRLLPSTLPAAATATAATAAADVHPVESLKNTSVAPMANAKRAPTTATTTATAAYEKDVARREPSRSSPSSSSLSSAASAASATSS